MSKEQKNEVQWKKEELEEVLEQTQSDLESVLSQVRITMRLKMALENDRDRLTKMIEEWKEKMANTKVQRSQIRVAIENAKKEGVVKELAARLAKEGMTINDPMWLRMAIGALNKVKEKKPYKRRESKWLDWADKVGKSQKNRSYWKHLKFPKGQKY